MVKIIRECGVSSGTRGRNMEDHRVGVARRKVTKNSIKQKQLFEGKHYVSNYSTPLLARNICVEVEIDSPATIHQATLYTVT